MPERGIEIEAGDARRRWIDGGLKCAAVKIETGARNVDGMVQERRMLRIEQSREQVERLSRHEFPADLVTGKMSAFQQHDAGAAASPSDSRGCARWASADDNQVVYAFLRHSALSISALSPV